MAGVSVPAVYQAFRGTGRLSQPTRERILATASQLGVRPNRTAANMKRGCHDAYGLLLQDWRLFPRDILFSLLDESRKRGKFLIIEYAPEGDLPRMFEEDCVDGVILFEEGTSIYRERLRRFRTPTVQVNANTRDQPGCITYDERNAMRRAIEHLHTTGRTCCALLLPPEASDHFGHYSVLERRQAFSESCDEMGMRHEVLIPQSFGTEAPARVLGERLGRDPFLDSVVLYSDVLRAGVYAAIQDAGFRPGREVGVIGFNNTWRSLDAVPPLTALGIPPARLAATVLDHLELGTKQKMPPALTLQYELVIRGSTVPSG